MEIELSKYDNYNGAYSYMLNYPEYGKEIRLFNIGDFLINLYTSSKNEYLNRICGLLGGMCNEIVYFGEHESGNGSDLEKASKIVTNMITRFGMSDMGLYTFPDEKDTSKYIYEEANKEKTQKAFE